jgi:hypothetical protein
MNNYHIWRIDPKLVAWWEFGEAKGTTPEDALRETSAKSATLFNHGDVVVVADHAGRHNGVGIFKIRKEKTAVAPAIVQEITL